MLELEYSDIEDCGEDVSIKNKKNNIEKMTDNITANNSNDDEQKLDQQLKDTAYEDWSRILADDEDDDNIVVTVNADLEIMNEVKELVRASIDAKGPCITILFADQLILVPINVKISNRLASMIWSAERDYVESAFPHMKTLNDLLRKSYTESGGNGNSGDEIIAYLATKYDRRMLNNRYYHYYQKSNNTTTPPPPSPITTLPTTSPSTSSSSSSSSSSTVDRNNEFKDCMSGLYRYSDFTIFIIKNGIIIDYAIHGYVSSINGAIEKHQPKTIYYNAKSNDALDVFLHYQYQPFYTTMKDRLQPVQIGRSIFSNAMAFCDRHDAYCSLCIGIRDLRNWLFCKSLESNNTANTNNHNNVRRRLDCTKLSCLENINVTSTSKLNRIIRCITKQPESNAECLRLQRAAKSLGRFGRKLTLSSSSSPQHDNVTTRITELISFSEKLEREKLKRRRQKTPPPTTTTTTTLHYRRRNDDNLCRRRRHNHYQRRRQQQPYHHDGSRNEDYRRRHHHQQQQQQHHYHRRNRQLFCI